LFFYWGYNVVEMYTFFVTLIRQLDFSLPDNGQEVRVVRLGLIGPVVVGEEYKGQQIPLKVTVLGSEYGLLPWCSPDSCARGERVVGMTKTYNPGTSDVCVKSSREI
jgi:hypothetical protein